MNFHNFYLNPLDEPFTVASYPQNRKWKYSSIWEIKLGWKTKVDQQYRFILRLRTFFPSYFDHWKPKYGSLGCTIFSKCSQIKPTFLHSMCIVIFESWDLNSQLTQLSNEIFRRVHTLNSKHLPHDFDTWNPQENFLSQNHRKAFQERFCI